MFNQPGPGGPQQQLPTANLIAALGLMALLYVAYFFFLNPTGTPTAQDQSSVVVADPPSLANPTMDDLTGRFGLAGALDITSLNADGTDAAHGFIDESSGLFHSLTLADYFQTTWLT